MTAAALFAPWAALCHAAGTSPAAPQAGNREEDDKDNTVRLTLHPAPEHRAALRYRLLPGIMEQTPGNGALEYARLSARIKERWTDHGDRVWDFVEMTLEDLPREQVRSTLGPFTRELEDLKRAARLAIYDWQLPPIGESNFFSLLVAEDVTPVRHLAQLLALQARLEIVEGRFDDAVETLKTGYAVARHLGEGPLMIHALTGIAISEVMSQQVLEMISQPGAPNLYWGLSALPHPLIDMRRAMDFEMHWIHWSYSGPGPGRLDEKPSSAERWARALVDMGPRPRAEEEERLQMHYTFFAMRLYPRAKRFLVERGRSRAEVEAMPVAEAVGLWMMEPYVEARDRMCKWFYLPYWQARDGLRQAEQDYMRECQRLDAGTAPLLHLLGPLPMPMFARDRNERTIAALRTLEAIRMYGARHGGRLPEKLSDCEVPIPINPLTGRPLSYQKHDERAVLEAPPTEPDRGDPGIRYEIELAR
jgi:hypothetical protein